MIRKELFFAFFLSLCAFLFSWAHYVYFSEALNNNEWESVNGFTRIVIPDTFLYKEVLDFSDPLTSVVLAGVKNTVGPSLIWYVTNGKWISVLAINAVLLFLTVLYLARLARLMRIARHGAWALMAIVALLPATIYHSVGALKEIPTLLFLTGFFYHYLKGDRTKWVLFSLACILFRYQLAFLLFAFLVVDRFQRKALLYAFFMLIVLSALYPYIGLGVFSAGSTESFRDLYGADGSLGGIVESARERIPVLSVFAILFRIIQSIFEPLLTFIRNPSFYENGDISVIRIVYVFSALPMLRYWLLFLKRMVSMLVNPDDTDRNVIRLYTFCLVFIVPIGGFSFIHHRYLYPMTALVLVAAAIRLKSVTFPRSHLLRVS